MLRLVRVQTILQAPNKRVLKILTGASLLGTRAASSSGSTVRTSLPNHAGVNWKLALPFGFVVGGSWYYFLLHVTNDERWSASVVKQVFKNICDNQDVVAKLGNDIAAESAWWLPGERPWVTGKVEMPKGVVDVSFRLKGSEGTGTVYFTSVRKRKGADFTNIRYKFIGDDGTEIDLLPTLQ